MLVRDRPRLTEQALRTLFANTPKDQFNLTVVDDGSWPETRQVITRWANYDNVEVVTFLKPVGVVGFLRNVGAGVSERVFGRGEWLYHSDNDVAFLPDWLHLMTCAMDEVNGGAFEVLGGYQHPFHGTHYDHGGAHEADAVAGYSHLMRWETWDESGPYDQHAKGVCQSEDFAFCRKVLANGGNVGYIHPPVLANCGLTNSEHKPAVGAEHFPRLPGLVYE